MKKPRRGFFTPALRADFALILMQNLGSTTAWAQEDALTEGLRDVKAPVSWPVSFLWIGVIGGILLLVLAAGLIIWFIRKKKQPKAEVVIPVSPWDKALAEIKALQDESLPGQGRFKEFYSRLSEIVRHYFEDRFAIKAPEMTTEEFLTRLQHNPVLSGHQKNVLKEFLMSCDLVKFAKYTPEAQDAENSVAFACQLVEETKGEAIAMNQNVGPDT